MKTRRDFLKSTLTGVAASWTLPSFLHHTAWSMEQANASSNLQAATGRDHPILVVLQLGGGNDGLNTVIPYTQDAYFKARPQLKVDPARVLRLNDSLGLHPALSGIRTLFDEGRAAIINGVGYPNPNRSHFRSMEIWHTASDADKNEYYGWLGRYFDNTCGGEPEPTLGIALSNAPPQAFHGVQQIGISMRHPKSYQFIGESGDIGMDEGDHSMSGDSIQELGSAAPGNDVGSPLDFLKRTTMDAEVSSETIRSITARQKNSLEYPRTRLANDLSLVAQLIAGGMPTRIYYVNLGGFDTHANQQNAHERLLKEFSEAVTAFCGDLNNLGLLDRVLVMSFSEFGRRVAENASGGTDHGVAGPMFLFGGALKAGLHGEYPSLTDLNKGDLKHRVDFRSVYATVLDRWMNVSSRDILKREFPHLGII
ncbi:MAG: DUF1501 domain-containing protein [Candidatus Methylacidiphilales bacterium]